MGDAARSSWRAFAQRWTVLVGAWGVQLGAVLSGVAGSVALVGALIAGPLVMIATVSVYRRLQDQPVVMP